MNTIWEFGEKISSRDISGVESFFNVSLPNDYKKVVKSNNGANPTPDGFDIPNEKAKVFDCLVSVLKEDEDNVYECYNILSKDYNIHNLIPFGIDGFGNYLCFEKESMDVWYFDLEIPNDDYNGVLVTDSFSSFVNSLYIPDEDT